MTFNFRQAKRESLWTLLGLAGGTGSGKTFSAMKLAKGMAGGKRFAVLDTENGRAKFYADMFDFDHADLQPPFTPGAYEEGIRAAANAGYEVILIDSGSHEWSGEGGVLDLQEAELKRMAGDDYHKREACKMASWVKPKMAHKAMVQKLLQIPAHVIICFRAEPHIEMVKEGNRTVVKPKSGLTGYNGWFPVCEKSLPFEMTSYFLLLADKPGVPLPITLREPHRPFFPLDRPLCEESGAQLAAWARGGAAPTTATSADKHGIAAADIPNCDICMVPLVWRPGRKPGEEEFLACATWEKHKDTPIKIPLSTLRQRIADRQQAS